MGIVSLFVAVAVAAACVPAGAVTAHAQVEPAVPDTSPPADRPGDAALAKAHAEATNRLNPRAEDDPLESAVPWTERGGAAGHMKRYGTPAPVRPGRR
jgi:hypothetical protein